MFTQPAQLRMVFPDESEGRIALETYGEVLSLSLSRNTDADQDVGGSGGGRQEWEGR